MASAVQVCSNALVMLGEKPISSFDEADQSGGLDRATLCDELWPTARDAVLRSHPWKCAKTRVILSPEATTPAFGYSQQFILPSNWLRNVEINGVRAEHVDYEVETASSDNTSKRLLIDQGQVNLIYIWRNDQVESWDALLVEAAELMMASKMAYAITQSQQVQAQYAQLLEIKLREARAVDGQDESPQTFGSFEVLNARRSVSPRYR